MTDDSFRFEFRAGSTDFILRGEDCLAGMRTLPDDSLDVVVTSPPYNLGIAYSRYHDRRSDAEYLDWTLQWTREVFRLLRREGSFFFNLGAAPADPWRPHQVAVKLKESGFALQNTFHWIKSITVETIDGQVISAGHFKPINSDRYVTDCHEFVFHLTKTGDVKVDRLGLGVPYMDKSNIRRWSHTGGRDKRCRGNNWFIPYQTITSRAKDRPHPATFPVDLAAFCLKIHGLRSDLVMMDPFLGIGHAALAAKQAGVAKFIGFEIDPEYLQTARENLQPSANGALRPSGNSRQNQKPRNDAGELPLWRAEEG